MDRRIEVRVHGYEDYEEFSVSSWTSENNQIAECQGFIYYPLRACHLSWEVEPAYQHEVMTRALEVLRHATAQASGHGIEEYFSWGILSSHWPAVMTHLLPGFQHRYTTAYSNDISPEQAFNRRTNRWFVIWRASLSTLPSPGLPTHSHIEGRIKAQIEEDLCSGVFLPEEVSLLVNHFLGKQLTKAQEGHLFEPGGLIERFEQCATF